MSVQDTESVNGRTPQWLEDLDGTDRPTVAALCEKYGTVCESAVDPLEVASALEFDGFGDNSVWSDYGVGDVFALARVMYRRVPRRPQRAASLGDATARTRCRSASGAPAVAPRVHWREAAPSPALGSAP